MRDDEVRHFRTTLAAWTLVCDEVIRLGQRYCSLTSTARPIAGEQKVDIELSTDDRGLPAAVLVLPAGVVLARGLEIKLGKARQTPTRLEIRTCDTRSCVAVWPLDRAAFLSLHSSGVMFTFQWCRSVAWSTPVLASASCSAIEASVPSAGLREAIALASNSRALPADPLADLRSTFPDATPPSL